MKFNTEKNHKHMKNTSISKSHQSQWTWTGEQQLDTMGEMQSQQQQAGVWKTMHSEELSWERRNCLHSNLVNI